MLNSKPTIIGTNSLPECLSPARLPKELRAAEAGKLEMLSGGKENVLSGGHKFTLYEYADGLKGAVVHLAGTYPESGRVATNKSRIEKITLIDGQATLEINGQRTELRRGSFAVVADGDTYSLEGTGTLVVAVRDGEAGTTVLSDRH